VAGASDCNRGGAGVAEFWLKGDEEEELV
jgi:hypothetical protein